MHRSGIAVLLSGFFLSLPCHAVDCWLSPPVQSPMSMAAPEMLGRSASGPQCASAKDLAAHIRARSAPVATRTAPAYVPMTKDDNTPWRFNMSQNGKRMTSAEFEAWMKAKGIRVATGKPAPVATVPDSPPIESAVEGSE